MQALLTVNIFAQWLSAALLCVSANAIQGDREECLAAGMDNYVVKPIRVDALAAALQGVTRRREIGFGSEPAMQALASGR